MNAFPDFIDRGGVEGAVGKGEGREDGLILRLGINEERGYFRQLAQPSS
jgi:hypothetical protein